MLNGPCIDCNYEAWFQEKISFRASVFEAKDVRIRNKAPN